MTRKDGSLALLVVVVWGLNRGDCWGLHNGAAADAGGPALCWSPSRRCCLSPGRPSAAPAAGLWPTISFGQFAFLFCAIGLGMLAGLASLVAGASLFYHHSWRLRLWRTLTGQAAGGDRAGDLRRAGAGRRSLGGEHVPLVGFMLTGRRRSAGPAAIFSTKKSCPRRPARQSYRWWCERIDPGAAVYVCLVADRCGLRSCWRVYARSIC